MMYKELIKRLRDLPHLLFVQLGEHEELVYQAADAIESTSKAYQMMVEAYESEVTKHCWIPVTKRLPEEKTYVLILADTIAGKMVKVGFLYKDSAGKNCWTALDEYGKNLFDWQPTHWMPLPEPPKDGET